MPAGLPRVAIAMATFNPDRELFGRQVESIRAQTGCDWHCFISDDHSGADGLAVIEEVIEGDGRFTLSRSPSNLGFYRNFERALGMVPADFDLIALSDQDDVWHEDKLSSLADGIGEAGLVYSDQRLVDEQGNLIAPTYWTTRKNCWDDLISLLIANTVTGAASMIRRSLLDLALPFPELPGEQYHDHWLALIALASGEISYIDRPLYDYVQHRGAVLGHEKANAGLNRFGWRRLDPRRWREILGGWASAYFDVYLRLRGLAQVTLDRTEGRIDRHKKKELERFIGSDRSLAGMLWLALRPLRRFWGHSETLGMERVLVRGILYRHLAAIKRRLPGKAAATVSTGLQVETEITPQMRQKVAPLFPVASKSQPERINLLIPTIDLDHLFGGYIAKFNLARRLAESGHRTRIVTVDPTPPLPSGWQAQVESFSQLEGLFDQVEIVFARDGREPFRINENDRFIATTWWTAHIASRLAAPSQRPFLYMIQEYEPLTVPEGKWAELAGQSYRFDHNALFSTSILRDYFRAESIGVYGQGAEEGHSRSTFFNNAITPIPRPSEADLAERPGPGLVFYARPESHAARNLYEVGITALREAVAEGVFGDEWTFSAIGSTGSGDHVDLGGGRSLKILPRTDQAGYGEFLAGHDLGIALMDAPHPSLVPLEMARAGMSVVTTTWGESKTSEKLAALSPNLIGVAPDSASVLAGLREAAARTSDLPARVDGAGFQWSDDWDEALDGQVMTRVLALLGDG